MDESVKRALSRWPDVPAVHGWLALDESGRWYLRGEPVTHPGLVAFMNRNYDRDDAGRWFFQNGPQRGYVRLGYTPWVLHVDSGGRLRTHTGRTVAGVNGACIDDEGHLLLDTEAGVGLVNADSLATVAEWLVDEAGDALEFEAFAAALDRWQARGQGAGGPGSDARSDGADMYLRFGGRHVEVAFVPRVDVARRFGFDPDPQPDSTPDPRSDRRPDR